VTTFDQGAPWTVTATGTGPIVFSVYTFSWNQYVVTGLSLSADTGVMTPPDNGGRASACTGNWAGNTSVGVTITVVATNDYGTDSEVFTVHDPSWCP
jgi:hypothetical protein